MKVPILRIGTHGKHEVTEEFLDKLIANTIVPVPFVANHSPTSYNLGWANKFEKTGCRIFATLELTKFGLDKYEPRLATVPMYLIEPDARLVCLFQTAYPALDPRNQEAK